MLCAVAWMSVEPTIRHTLGDKAVLTKAGIDGRTCVFVSYTKEDSDDRIHVATAIVLVDGTHPTIMNNWWFNGVTAVE